MIEKFDKSNLLPNEEFKFYAKGNKKGHLGSALLILTNLRIIFFKPGLTGSTVEKYQIKQITSSTYKTGLLADYLTINFGGGDIIFQFTAKEKADGKKLSELIDNALNGNVSEVEKPTKNITENIEIKQSDKVIQSETTNQSENIKPSAPQKSGLQKFIKIALILFGVFFSLFIILGIIAATIENNKKKENISKVTQENNIPTAYKNQNYNAEKIKEHQVYAKKYKTLYDKLMSFKNKQDFHEMEFAIAGNYNGWMKEVYNLSKENAIIEATIDLPTFYLIDIARAYARSQGKSVGKEKNKEDIIKTKLAEILQ